MQATTTTLAEHTTLCKRAGCSRPVFHVAGHRKRAYCSDACRQQDYRTRKAGASEKANHQVLRKLIAQLETRVHELEAELAAKESFARHLQARLMLEECLQADTEVRHFKAWLKKQHQPPDTTFARRFLADSRLPQHASRALYEAKLRAYEYSAEEVYLFRDLWLALLLDQS